ncbi:MAG: DUF4922 domain-containing protein [Bacteroidetes bacterium]|nr:DUF4922 domain-containing protein [Bacteroidota bacterium]
MHLNDQALQLLQRQQKEWPLAAANYAALSRIETKKLSINGFDFFIQFNPARITSSAAKTDAQTIRERPCFLCRHHLPLEQEVLPYRAGSGNEYMILSNPYPIFPLHLTIPDRRHTKQLMWGRMDDMLELADQLPDFVLLYNGPKCGASAPDHFHFQAGNKGFLPIQTSVEGGASLDNYPVKTYLFEWEKSLPSTFSFVLDPEPMINLLCWKTGSKYYTVVFPRKCHRPAQFFATGAANILLSPATIDLGGVLITPLEKDFRKLTAADVSDIFNQITLL